MLDFGPGPRYASTQHAGTVLGSEQVPDADQGKDFGERPKSRHREVSFRRPVGSPSKSDDAQDLGLVTIFSLCSSGSLSSRFLMRFRRDGRLVRAAKRRIECFAKGFTQKESRRAILRSSCCDLLGYFYHCHGCKSNNKGKEKVGLAYNRRPRRCLPCWILTNTKNLWQC